MNVAGLLRGTTKGGHHPRISNRLRRAINLDGAGGANTVVGMREGHMTLPRTLKVTRQRDETKIEMTPVHKMAAKMRWHPRMLGGARQGPERDQERLHDEMEVTCESMVAASRIHRLLCELEWGLSGGQHLQGAARQGLR